MTPDVTAGDYAAGQKCTGTREATMREAQVESGMIVGLFLLVAMTGTGRAEHGFDEKYQRDFNIFNPINVYAPATPPIRSTSSIPTIRSIR